MVTTQPELDPVYHAFKKWYCPNCDSQFTENFPKGQCQLFGVIMQERCGLCTQGHIAKMKNINCQFFKGVIHAPKKWQLQKIKRKPEA